MYCFSMEFITLEYCQLCGCSERIASSIGGSIVPPTHCFILLYIEIVLSYFCAVLFSFIQDCLEDSRSHLFILWLCIWSIMWPRGRLKCHWYFCTYVQHPIKVVNNTYIETTICQPQILPLNSRTPFKFHSN